MEKVSKRIWSEYMEVKGGDFSNWYDSLSPIENYLFSLKNFMISKNKSNFDNYKIFDYRIKNQLILQ